MKWMLIAALAACVAGCDSGGAEVAAATASEPAAVAAPNVADQEWNVSDPDIKTNGNLSIAVAKLLRGDAPPAGSAALGQVIKAPWKYYGQRLCFPAQVTHVQDYPPGTELAGFSDVEWSEAVAATGDLEFIDMVIIGGSGNIAAGHDVNFCGLVAGRVEVQNMMGGMTTQLVMVGKLKDPAG